MMAIRAASRPRVEGEREDEILDSTVELLIELGYDRLTMDAVATRARASKATLYRRWETKASLVVEALIRAKQSPTIGDLDTGTLRGDLLAAFCGSHGINETATQILGSVITALSTDAEFAEQFREKFLAPKVALTQAVYQRAQQRGEIPADLDLEVIGPALAGILLHRTFILGVPPDDTTIERVVDQVILPAVHHPPHGTGRPSTTSTSDTKARTTA